MESNTVIAPTSDAQRKEIVVPDFNLQYNLCLISPSGEQEFCVTATFERDTRWLGLEFYYVLFPYNKEEIGNRFPLVLNMNEADKSKDLKKGDFYHFAGYHTYCQYHGQCETNFGFPMHEQKIDRDISRLVKKGELISQMLIRAATIPGPLSKHWLIGALKNNNLEQVAGKPYELRGKTISIA